MLSTAVMAKRGLVYRDEMVAMKPTNEKLRRRAVRIVSELATQTPETAEDFLRKSNWNLPLALISAKWGISAEAAADYLSKRNSNVAAALSQPPERDRG
jgi:N-acetylmuramic acid 6-phosphate etherase